MRVYAVTWCDEPPKHYAAETMHVAIDLDFAVWADDLTPEDAARPDIREEYEQDLTSVALLCELEAAQPRRPNDD